VSASGGNHHFCNAKPDSVEKSAPGGQFSCCSIFSPCPFPRISRFPSPCQGNSDLTIVPTATYTSHLTRPLKWIRLFAAQAWFPTNLERIKEI